MNKNILGFKKTTLAGLFFLSVLSSCVTQKNITYFQDANTGENVTVPIAKFIEPVIQIDDILSISIQTLDPQNSAVVNLGTVAPVVGSAGTGGSAPQINGFLVDKNGEIELLMIGKIKVAGLTTFEAKQAIAKAAQKDYRDPNVQVRFANFKVTVLGEVARPATYTLPNEKVSILDVIGLAGDLTIYGKRENISVVREIDGKKQIGYLNLNSTEIFNSPYYYLKQNDYVYVEPNKAKIATTDASRTRMITVGASIASALIVLLLRLL